MIRVITVAVLVSLFGIRVAIGQQLITPVKPVSAIHAVSTETLLAVTDVRELPAGVLVYDDVAKRMVLLDDSLRTVKVVADTTGSTWRHGRTTGRILPFDGDSSLFVDPSSEAIHVVSPAGEIVRTMAAPVPTHMGALVTSNRPGVHGHWLVYRIGRSGGGPAAGVRAGPPARRGRVRDDSVLVVRAHLIRRTLDTVATLYLPRSHTTLMFRGNPPVIRVGPINPLDRVDQWVVRSDGGVVVVRGDDYHLDIIGSDGRSTALPRIPFEWQRLSDIGKEHYLDSLKRAQQARMAAERASVDTSKPMEIAEAARRSRRAGNELDVPGVEYDFVAANELPDYRAAFGRNGVLADQQNRVWVRVLLPQGIDGEVYDVIGADGAREDRVGVPAGHTIVGIGARNVYVVSTGADDVKLKAIALWSDSK